ncbi:MAG: hypothetical protein M3139_10945 [Bacteroidota bacterium]|nr:hypothetical protein [Bacteroidota bacterium]
MNHIVRILILTEYNNPLIMIFFTLWLDCIIIHPLPNDFIDKKTNCNDSSGDNK